MPNDHELTSEGFTPSGLQKYRQLTDGYADELFAKSKAVGDQNKASNTQREVTHELVRDAAERMARRRASTTTSTQFAGHVGEYLCAVTAGAAGNNLNSSVGIWVFAAAGVIGMILLVWRIVRLGSS